ncbi:MGDG synthase family glycosyltransferase [Desulfotruncus alcoholivorax]|uniref:MGDG synthase family glycosyltransferase n=1 Tax=Desulfotruncus alcoholivorax TaxID=265477 RepID=UPI0005529BD6|nr:glycosyltransferase [Desulfotruncus alcoholivorax]
MQNLKVLIFSSTFGAGHVRAAEAVIEALEQKVPGVQIAHLDCGAIISRFFNSVIKSTYIGMLKYTPKLWGKFYYNTSKMQPDSAVQRFLNQLGQKEFDNYIQSFQPDLIICTYPTVAGVLAQLRLKGVLNIPLATVITDYSVHSQWIHRGVDLYLVGCPDVYQGLVARGINPGRICITGIPVSPRFENPMNRQAIAAKLGLQPDRPTVLIMGGAYGVLPNIKQICRTFAGSALPVQLIVVCGRNRKLYKSLEDVQQTFPGRVICLGYVNNVEEFMAVSDVMISKAGGLTVSEALTMRLPQLIFKPIPGQEEDNAIYINKTGAGRIVHTLEGLKENLQYLLENPEVREEMRRAAALAVPGHASEKAVEHLLELADKHQNKTTARMIV